jgi:hypothetical protein
MQRPMEVHPLTAMREAAWTWWRNVPAPRDMARVPPLLILKKFARLREDVCHIPMPLYCKAAAAHPDLPDAAALPRQGGAVLLPSALVHDLCAQREARLLVEDMPVLGAGIRNSWPRPNRLGSGSGSA